LTDFTDKYTIRNRRTKPTSISPKRNNSKVTKTGITLAILLLSVAIFSTTEGRSIALAQQQPVISIPQANAPQLLKVTSGAHGAFFVPDLGLASFYGPANAANHIPAGLDEQKGVFNCSGDPIKCGKNITAAASFDGTLEQGNKHHLTKITATFTSPVESGALHNNTAYKITATDFTWNTTLSEKATPQPDFTKPVPVKTGGQQHGVSLLDRSDVQQISENPGGFTYGPCDVMNMKAANHTQAYCHFMVGHLLNETNFYKYMRDDPTSPNLAIAIVVSIPAGVKLPGDWSKAPIPCTNNICTADQAQQFFPMRNDPALKPGSGHPPVAYPVSIPYPRSGSAPITAPGPSQEQPVSLKGQPFFFAFVVYPLADIREIKQNLAK
jgi:hypothetical protein